MPDTPEELKLKLAIKDHAACCPNLENLNATAKRVRELNGIDKTVAHHEQTLYGDDRGLLMRMDRTEKEVSEMSPKVNSLQSAHMKIIGAMLALGAIGSIFGFLGFERLMRAVNAVAAVAPAVPK